LSNDDVALFDISAAVDQEAVPSFGHSENEFDYSLSIFFKYSFIFFLRNFKISSCFSGLYYNRH